MVRKGTRRGLLALGGVVLFFLILVLALPLWLPWVLGTASESYGLRYSGYSRLGYSRFALSDVVFTNRNAYFTAKRVEADVPTGWLWRLYVSGRKPFARIDGWKLVLQPATEETGEPSEPSVPRIYRQTDQALARVNQWLPGAVLQDGTIQAGEQMVLVPHAKWEEEKLFGRVVLPQQGQEADVVADLGPQGRGHLGVRVPALNLDSEVLMTEQADGLLLQSTNVWLTNRVVAQAEFGRTGLVPLKAEVVSRGFSVPAHLLELKEYGNVEGDLSVRWLTNEFTVDLSARAAPNQGAELPPVHIQLAGSGNLDAATVQKAEIKTPWLEANLREGTMIQYTSPFLQEQTMLTFVLDLAQQRWFEGKGKLEGQIEFRPGQGALPDSIFSLKGTELGIADLRTVFQRSKGTNISREPKPLLTRSLDVQGEAVWPELRLTQARVETQDGSTLSLNGIADLSSQMVHYGQFAYEGLYAREWLPPGMTYTNASLSGNLNGPFTNLSHAGQVQVKGFKMPLLPVLDISGTWKGEQLRLDPIQLSLQTGKSTLGINGAIDLGKETTMLRVVSLALTNAGVEQLVAEKPFEVSWEGGSAKRARLSPLQWSGPAGSVEVAGEVAWPFQGRVESKVRSLKTGTFSDFWPWVTNQLMIQGLDLRAAWSNGPVDFRMELSAAGRSPQGITLGVAGEWQGGAEGLNVERLTITSQDRRVALVNGTVPVAVHPGRTNRLLDAKRDAPLTLNAEVEPGAFVEYFKAAGLELEQPKLRLQLTGTLGKPKGRVEASVARVQFSRANTHLPPLDNMKLVAWLEPDRVRVEALEFSVAEQPLSLQAEAPLGRESWLNFSNGVRVLDWKQAKAELKIERMQLSALGPYLPKIVSPEGEMEGAVSLLPGGNLAGSLTVARARTYPIGNVGAVRDILVRLRFEGRRAFLEAAAELGGQPVPVTGTMDLRGEEWLAGKLPPFQLKVGGAQVPLSRTPEMILKADLDVAIEHDGKEPVTLTGNVHLRDGFFLRDIADLTSGKVSAPSRRPPYFSIEQQPLADWRLRLNVTGEKFLKVRSTLFNGVVSTGLRLQGTLREPLATGDLKIDSGEVRFPFATMQVTRGLVTLTSENPYRPQLSVTAGARTFGYDVKMELSGFADQPVIQFTSIPALSSEQILLMVSAGDLPRGEITVTGTQRAQRLALFVGRDLLSELGFAGDASRLTIRSGEDISEAGRPTYSVEYKLQENWSVIGEYDRFNDYNLMLKWRIYSK